MKEIKLRAWNKKTNDWHKTELLFYGFHVFGECTLVCPPKIEDLEDLEVTLSTGRKDINGKECYLDDIVKYKVSIVTDNNDIGEEELIDRVSFDIAQSSIFPLVMVNEFEIIGNFYQDKNLIKS